MRFSQNDSTVSMQQRFDRDQARCAGTIHHSEMCEELRDEADVQRAIFSRPQDARGVRFGSQ